MSRARSKWRQEYFGSHPPELIEEAARVAGVHPAALCNLLRMALLRGVVEKFGEEDVRSYMTGGRSRRRRTPRLTQTTVERNDQP